MQLQLKRERDRPYLQIANVNKEFLIWLEKYLGNKCNSIKDADFHKDKWDDGYERRDLYLMRTRSLPCLNQFCSWYDNGEKRFPDNLNLTPMALKMWYVCDGTKKVDDDLTNGSPRLSIGCSNENDRQEYINNLFDDIGVSPTWAEHYFTFRCEDSSELWEYMGTPVPGFEYKWPEGWSK